MVIMAGHRWKRGISITLSFGREYDSRHDHWMFVRERDIERSGISRYYVNRSDHERIVRNSTVINNTYVDNSRHTTYVSGPAREDLQRATGRRTNPVRIQEDNRPGQGMKKWPVTDLQATNFKKH